MSGRPTNSVRRAFQRHDYENYIKGILSRSTVRENIVVLPGQLDRDSYLRVDKVLRAIGGKWFSRLQKENGTMKRFKKDGLAVSGTISGRSRVGKLVSRAFLSGPSPFPARTRAAPGPCRYGRDTSGYAFRPGRSFV
jgi:hypothetical protein